MGKISKQRFVFDTSALISLGTASLLDKTLTIAEVTVTSSVIRELEDFAQFEDKYGKAAKEVLRHKDKFQLVKASIKESIKFIEKTDNELYNLAKQKSLDIITDDIKFARQVNDKIGVKFSTFVIAALVSAGNVSKQEALELLENLRSARTWRNNIIFLTSKEELEKL